MVCISPPWCYKPPAPVKNNYVADSHTRGGFLHPTKFFSRWGGHKIRVGNKINGQEAHKKTTFKKKAPPLVGGTKWGPHPPETFILYNGPQPPCCKPGEIYFGPSVGHVRIFPVCPFFIQPRKMPSGTRSPFPVNPRI